MTVYHGFRMRMIFIAREKDEVGIRGKVQACTAFAWVDKQCKR